MVRLMDFGKVSGGRLVSVRAAGRGGVGPLVMSRPEVVVFVSYSPLDCACRVLTAD